MARDYDFEDKIYAQAVAKNNWHMLIGYPRLLFRWQYKHSDSVMPIAKIASHKLDKHTWCKTQQDCEDIEKLIFENDPQTIVEGMKGQ